MTRFIWHEGAWRTAVRVSRPSAFPSIITDTQDALLHPADGKRYDSKSQFRRVTKEHGLIELGNDAPMTRRAELQPEGVEDDIAQSIEMLRQGYQPPPDASAGTLDGAAIEPRMIPNV